MMLGARTGAWAKSGGGVPTARDYVQDGLVAMWDGIENAGWGTHDASETVWKDLIGQYDFTLQGAVFDDNSLASIAKGNVATAASYPVIGTYSPKTIEILVKRTGGDHCIAKFGLWQLWRESSGTYYVDPSTSNSAVTNNMATVDENKANTFSFALADAQTMATYCNGAIQSGGKIDYWSNEMWQIFGRNSNYSTGNAYCVRYYFRALTAEEIAANYAIDKARFNLP